MPRMALDMSIAHDLASAQAAAGHVDRHLSEAQAAHAAEDPVSVIFNSAHAAHHVTEVAHNLSELHADLARRLPAVAAELARLGQASGRAAEDDATWQREMRSRRWG